MNPETETETEPETLQTDEKIKIPYKRKSRAKPKKEIVVLDPIIEVNDDENDVNDNIETTEYDTFLDEMCNETETDKIVNDEDEPVKKTRKTRTKKEKQQDTQEHKNINDMDNDELYADDATPILGKDRLQIIKKIESYKVLFKDELKNFKLAKNPTIDMLEMALAEIETIIELGTIDSFITDSIIQCIKLAEGASSYTKYNISGLSAILKENRQFHSLLKVLYLKHQVFSEVPPEYQLLMLVTTTSILCVQKNSSKKQTNERLNEPMIF